MNIYFSASDHNACAYYRMELPHRLLVRKRLAVGTLGFINDPLLQTNMEDLCVIQRQYSPHVFKSMEHKRSLGIRIVGDVDDNMWALKPDNPAYTVFNGGTVRQKEQGARASGQLRPEQHFIQPSAVLADFFRYCDAVTVPTEPLAVVLRKYNRNTWVVPNWLDDSVLTSYPKPLAPDKKIRILWTGSDSHRDELIPSFTAIRRLLDEDSRIVFCYVGYPHPILDTFPRDRVDFYPPTQFVPQYYWLLSKIPAQIAIAPLDDSMFARSKSWIKALEYGLFGYFPVLQDSPPYRALSDLGLADLPMWVKANTEEIWYRSLRSAVADVGQCLQRAERYQEGILAQCLISQNIQRWLKCYTKVLGSPSTKTPRPRYYQV